MRALAIMALLWTTSAVAQMTVVMSRSGYVREGRSSDTEDCYHAPAGDSLQLLDEDFTNGYYHVLASNGCDGFVYRNLGRRPPNAPLPSWAGGNTNNGPDPVAGDERLTICSFNIKWLGHYTRKEHEDLARMMQPYDMIVVQELVAPPVSITLPSRTVDADEESEQFFQFMAAQGFKQVMAPNGTGKTEPPAGSTSQEWPVVFYRDDEVRYMSNGSGFVADPSAVNPTFDRVPYAFRFATVDGTLDFTLINAHLKQVKSDGAGRKAELDGIARWCTANAASTGERDHLIVGDLNIQSLQELTAIIPPGFASLNAMCKPTNLNASSPYDHVLYRTTDTAGDLVLGADTFEVLDLVQLARNVHGSGTPHPVDDRDLFGQMFSDHRPVVFNLKYGIRDDD